MPTSGELLKRVMVALVLRVTAMPEQMIQKYIHVHSDGHLYA